MAIAEKSLITAEEYLVRERKAEFKSEFYQGEIFAMAGASARHNLIVTNLIISLGTQLRKRPCLVYPSDLKLKVQATGLFTYPDVSVVCGEPKFLDERGDVLTNPNVIIEVLSESTEASDRGKKFENYRTIPSLQQYVLIAQERIAVDCFTRGENGVWLLRSYADLQTTLRLESIQSEVPLAEIYDKVQLDPPEEVAPKSDVKMKD